MSAALSRRDDGCASDLLMDRWLLGEIPGSDEGRQLEEHVRRCAGCATRLQALRSLYGNKPQPRAEEPLPPLSAPPSVLPPEHAAVLQVIILRDGLLVGTEMFTAGRYKVGAGAGCSLKLDDLQPVHAVISLQGERIALEAAGGPLFVNGFRATACELRPIDEVAVGPYVLRARVIAERWNKPKLHLVDAHPLPRRGPFDSAALRSGGSGEGRQALKLELFWGDTCVEVKVIDAPENLRAFGIETVQQIDGGFSLDGLRVTHGEQARFHVGHLVCIATAVPKARPVPRKSAREWPWLVMSLAASLAVAVVSLGVFASNLDPPDFVPRPIPKAVVHAFMSVPPPPVKKKQVIAKTLPTKLPIKKSPKQLVERVLQRDAIAGVLSKLSSMPMHAMKKQQQPGLLASLGSTAPRPAAGLGLHSDSFVGIGRAGLQNAGQLSRGNVGRGSVHGTVTPVRGNQLRTPPSSKIDRDALARVINSHLNEISACYERAMIKSGTFSGKMTLEWTISIAGKVSQSRVKDTTIKNAEFGSCVLSRLNGWLFPGAEEAATVCYPIILDAVGY